MFSRISNFINYQRGLAAISKSGIWFVDIPRTSSSSIRTELSHHYGPVYGKSDLQDAALNVQKQLIPSHLTALEMRQRIGKQSWDDLFTFSIVRNPWDRMISIFRYRKAVGEIDQETSYSEYLELFFRKPDDPKSPYHYHGYYYQAIDYLVDEFGEIMVDYIGRFENREKDLEILRKKCGCPQLGLLNTQCSPIEQAYSSYYNQETQDMVSAICKKDIEVFGYQF